MSIHSRRWALLTTLVAFLVPYVFAGEHNPVHHETAMPEVRTRVDLIVKLRRENPSAANAKVSTATDRTLSLATRSGVRLELRRKISEQMLASRVELGGMALLCSRQRSSFSPRSGRRWQGRGIFIKSRAIGRSTSS